MARHERCFQQGQKVLELEHYLDVLERKPGALASSTALAQWREQGKWPVSFDRYWEGLQQRQGKAAGTRAMIELVVVGKQCGLGPLRAAVEKALEAGAFDVGIVRYLLREEGLNRPTPEPVDVGELNRYDRPAPSLLGYDQLLPRTRMQPGVGR